MHINCLELLAPQQWLTSLTREAKCLTGLAKELRMWALKKDIILTAQHIPGVSDTVADMVLQRVHDNSDWMLCP